MKSLVSWTNIILTILWYICNKSFMCTADSSGPKVEPFASNNGLVSVWHQAIVGTNAGILINGSLGNNFNEISIEIHIFSFQNVV